VPRARTIVESALAHQRISLTIVLAVVPAICWIWIAAMSLDMYGSMSGASAWMMTTEWDARRVVLLWAMWAAMMAGMMLPSAAPLLLLYARAIRNRDDERHPARAIYAMAAGYVVTWALFSAAATALQRIFALRFLVTPMMEPASPRVAGVLLLLAGAYQFTPAKAACLSFCRSPIAFISSRWRDGVAGAFRMGASHGLYCLGCCWALMLLLFAGGVMNLAVILALTAWVAIEKIAPFGQQSARAAGALLVAIGIWMMVR
jgi:predicted metal-binding membrane protein